MDMRSSRTPGVQRVVAFDFRKVKVFSFLVCQVWQIYDQSHNFLVVVSLNNCLSNISFVLRNLLQEVFQVVEEPLVGCSRQQHVVAVVPLHLQDVVLSRWGVCCQLLD